jgi:hypothetical protein
VWEGEYGKYCVFMCENGKIIPVETILGMEEGGYRIMMEGMNSTMI